MLVTGSFEHCEFKALADIFTDSVHGLASGDYNSKQLAAWAPVPPDLNLWYYKLQNLETRVAHVGNDLAGFIAYKPSRHIDYLYVSPEYARRGVASNLYYDVEIFMRLDGVKELFVEASVTAKPFFESCGFSVVEEQVVVRNGVELARYAMRKQVSGG